MANIKYLLKGSKGRSTIYVRLYSGREVDITASIGVEIEPEFWSKKAGMPSQKAQSIDKVNVARDLKKLRRFIETKLDEANIKGIELNRVWLVDVINQHRNKVTGTESNNLTDLLEAYKDSLDTVVRNGKVGVAAGTKRNYNTTRQRLLKFEAFKKKNYLVSEVDLTFHSEYVKYAQNTLGLAINSIGKDIRQIKTVCLDARDKGIEINHQVTSRKFSSISEKTLFTTLNEQELELIGSYDGVPHLENARDWLIIGCWTGCRVGDLMKLTNENILTTTKGQKFIRYTQSKTNKTVDVPLHPHVKKIIEGGEGFPHAISDQRFNEYIKDVCEEVKLTYEIQGSKQDPDTHIKQTGKFPKYQLVTSHICRRSFATNHYGKVSNKLIMAVTGHSTERMLLSYIGEVENDHIEDFMSLWNDQASNKSNFKKIVAHET